LFVLLFVCVFACSFLVRLFCCLFVFHCVESHSCQFLNARKTRHARVMEGQSVPRRQLRSARDCGFVGP
jgi:hypothetical protein